jgi:MFS family permease
MIRLPTMYKRLFRNRNFVALWVGQMISFIGDYFVILAIPVVVNRLTGSATMVGLSYMAAAIPALFLGPVAGVFIDRWDRRKVMIASDVLRGLIVLVLLTVHTKEQVWVFFVINFLLACTSQFFLPARNAVLPLIVKDKEDWLAANGLMQIILTVGFLAGPALAGFSIGLWGEKVAFVANSIGYFASAAAVITMRVPHSLPDKKQENSSAVKAVLSELSEGVSTILVSRNLVGIMLSLAISQLGIGAIMVVWVPFLDRVFHQGAAGVGLVDSAFGVGMLGGGLILGFLSARIRKTTLAAGGMLGMGIISAIIGYSPAFWMIILENVFFGICLVPMQSALMTIMQLATPDAKRGRVSSSMNAVVSVGSLLSMALAAFASDAIGFQNLFLLVGIVIMIAAVLGFKMIREPEEDQPGELREPVPSQPTVET